MVAFHFFSVSFSEVEKVRLLVFLNTIGAITYTIRASNTHLHFCKGTAA